MQRYVSIRQNCSAAYENIISYGDALISFRDSRINVFQGIEDALNIILAQNNDFNSLLINFQSRVTQFSASTTAIKNYLISQSNGILATSNCSVIGETMQNTYTIFCSNFMSHIVKLGLFSIILSVFLVFGIWVSSLFSVRYADI
jgi:hypothetical protein